MLDMVLDKTRVCIGLKYIFGIDFLFVCITAPYVQFILTESIYVETDFNSQGLQIWKEKNCAYSVGERGYGE